MENHDEVPQVMPERVDISRVHKKMFDKMADRMVGMAVHTVSQGVNSANLFGLIIDIDDPVWREHVNLNAKIPPPNQNRSDGTNRRMFCGLTDRSDIQHLIDNVLPVFQEYFSEPPPIGHVHVLVLGAGMASPFTLHWGAKLELEWD